MKQVSRGNQVGTVLVGAAVMVVGFGMGKYALMTLTAWGIHPNWLAIWTGLLVVAIVALALVEWRS